MYSVSNKYNTVFKILCITIYSFKLLLYIYFFSVFFYNNYENKQKRIKDGDKIKTMQPLFSYIHGIYVDQFSC